MGTRGVGIMNSMAFLFLANNSSEVDENQRTKLMIESLSFYVGPSGSTRLFRSNEIGSVGKPNQDSHNVWSSVGSSSKVNSPVSFAAAGNIQRKIEKFELGKNST
jgi:hypothetical protein